MKHYASRPALQLGRGVAPYKHGEYQCLYVICLTLTHVTIEMEE
jgi:hypothetical protein